MTTYPLQYNQSQMYDSNLGGEYQSSFPTVPQPLTLGTTSKASDGGLFKYITPGETAGSGLGGLSAGLNVNPQGSDPYAAAFDVAGGIAGGALAGAPGGPIGMLLGGGIAGLVGLGKAYFGVSQQRKAERERKKMIAMAEAAQKRAEDNEERWKQTNRFDTLKQNALTRKDMLVQQGWQDYQNKLTIMNNFMNQNTQARDELMKLLQPVGK